MTRKELIISTLIFIVNIVGIIGTLHPLSHDLFLTLTPFNLIMNGLLLVYTDNNQRKNLLPFLIFSFSIGFTAEVIGVHSGLLFGDYVYGETLGQKVWGVPLTIGLNWFILSYSFLSITLKIRSRLVASIIGASLMTLMDVLIEPVAIKLDYWSWGGAIPYSNYLSWFLVSLLIQVFARQFLSISKQNNLTISVVIAMCLYMGVLLFFL